MIQLSERHRWVRGCPLMITHYHSPKIHCSNDDVILSNYHQHSFRPMPSYAERHAKHVCKNILHSLPLACQNVSKEAVIIFNMLVLSTTYIQIWNELCFRSKRTGSMWRWSSTDCFCGSSHWLYAWAPQASSCRPRPSTMTESPSTEKCPPSGLARTWGAKTNTPKEPTVSTSVSGTIKNVFVRVCACVHDPRPKRTTYIYI